MIIMTRIVLSLDPRERRFWRRQFKLLWDLGKVTRIWDQHDGDRR